MPLPGAVDRAPRHMAAIRTMRAGWWRARGVNMWLSFVGERALYGSGLGDQGDDVPVGAAVGTAEASGASGLPSSTPQLERQAGPRALAILRAARGSRKQE